VNQLEPLIDTHIHMWDLDDPTLRYDFLDPDLPHPILTPDERRKLAVPIFGAEQLRADTEPAGVVATVHVQAAVGIDDPVMETIWLERQRTSTGLPTVIVGHTDLASEDVAEQLDRHLEASPVFVGIRDSGHGSEFLDDPNWRRGVKALGDRNLICCLDVTMDRYELARQLADDMTSVTFVLDHMGLPLRRDDSYFAEWNDRVRMLAGAENLFCKISEQTLVSHRWDPQDAHRWMNGCIEVFGPSRCFFGSNWPVDSLHVSYMELTNAYRKMTSSLSPAEASAMNVGTAANIFSIQC
jgi:predicted TIM-barrel fold metal-dependent hydrolase